MSPLIYTLATTIARFLLEAMGHIDMSETIESLWTADDLGRFLQLAPQTVQAMASRSPERLPARVTSMKSLRWAPSVCLAWSIKQSSVIKTRRGRPRLSA